MIKGGVWKNSEDEILKAAVMKYGLNQWSRISSLLVRKSAKQCKARWYEWLDPSIKKTEWTREEEEKLLHLAKIFPCQWRTIAPIVGRTPAQCVEHYEKLLDQAQGKEEMDENDPRKLKPGEIDPNPETKAARPDPIDMDEDEKEMLAEARVRLANTKGKKAKRKARTKMMEEARRLAGIQKKRELRAAGIEVNLKKKIKGVDYNEEVPFERAPLEMLYQTDDSETPKPNLHLANISLQTLEGKRRTEEEETRRKHDEKKMKKLKDRDLPKAVETINKLNNAFVQNKSKLVLPGPQLHDKELEEMGKLNSLQQGQDGDESNATRFLVGNYTERQTTPTPMRTPRIENSVMREARHAAALLNTQTPLIGGNTEALESAHFSSVLPRTTQAQTPNVMMSQQFVTPKPKMGGISGTPFRRVGEETPRHDAFGINPDEALDNNWDVVSQSNMSVSAQSQRHQAAQIRQQIKSGLFSLPKPKNDYQIEMPELDSVEPEVTKKRKLDAEDQEALDRKMEEEKEERRKKLISQSVRKNLPRPYKPNRQLVDSYLSFVPEEAGRRKEAEQLLADEMLRMVSRDAAFYPFKGSFANDDAIEQDLWNETELDAAAKLLRDEMSAIKTSLKHGDLSRETMQNAWEEVNENVMFDEDAQIYIDGKKANRDDRIAFARSEFELKKDKLEQEAKKIEGLQKKVNLILGGYPKRGKQIQVTLSKHLQDLDQYAIEQEVFKQLQIQEQRACYSRFTELKKFYDQLTKKEAELQRNHEKLTRERDEAFKEAPVIRFI